MSTDRFRLECSLSRREALRRCFGGLGSVALATLLFDERAEAAVTNPLSPKLQHFPAKAKNCIFLFMSGGVSQMDTFDYKPELAKRSGTRLPQSMPGVDGALAQLLKQRNVLLAPVYPFEPRGQSGRNICSLFQHLGPLADDLGFVYGIRGDSGNHGPATMHVNTGSIRASDPSVGAWVTYGLGSMNQNLPGYVVLQDRRGGPVNGSAVWQSGYLPAAYQGTTLRSTGSPILNIESPAGVTRDHRRLELDFLKWLNEKHAQGQPERSELEARISAYELAFRMQTEAPDIVDIRNEPEHVRKSYGLDNPVTEPYGSQCLLARRLVERGVRFVLLVHGHENGVDSWDHHTEIGEGLAKRIQEVDKPVAGLLSDLKQRGLLDETLVVWTSEMGRTPFTQGSQPASPNSGRNHNEHGLVTWFAGGGVRGGSSVGQTDDFAMKAADDSVLMRDMHATLLHLLGVNQSALSFLHEGRYKKLTDTGGKILKEILRA